jgi:hypothetical protein
MAEPAADHLQAMADEFTQALGDRGFDPFAMIAGDRRFHAMFLAPITASLRAAMDRYLVDGGGSLADAVAYFRKQGLGATEAAARLREIIAHASGMLVVVLRDDQHLWSLPQFSFGPFGPEYIEHALRTCSEEGLDPDLLRAATTTLARRVEAGASWPALFAAVDGTDDPLTFWGDFGEILLASVADGIVPGIRQRQADLGHWTARALAELIDPAEDGDRLLLIVRCRCLAGDLEEAFAAVDLLLDVFEPVAEELLKLLDDLVGLAVRERQPERAVACFDRHRVSIDAVLGGGYEAAVAEFRACAAAAVAPERLLAAAERMRRGDKRSCRHDLNREPCWEVTTADPGPCLAAEEAAALLDRSVTFIAKRLEAGTIPFVRGPEGVAIPRRGLEAWRAVMDAFQLLA